MSEHAVWVARLSAASFLNDCEPLREGDRWFVAQPMQNPRTGAPTDDVYLHAMQRLPVLNRERMELIAEKESGARPTTFSLRLSHVTAEAGSELAFDAEVLVAIQQATTKAASALVWVDRRTRTLVAVSVPPRG